MKRYREVLARRTCAASSRSMLLARLPVGLNGLAMVLYLREQTGSFAIAGAVAGSLALGVGLGAPAMGRLVDRLGQWRVLLPSRSSTRPRWARSSRCTELGAPPVVLLVCGARRRPRDPPTSSVLRSAWPWLLPTAPSCSRPPTRSTRC